MDTPDFLYSESQNSELYSKKIELAKSLKNLKPNLDNKFSLNCRYLNIPIIFESSSQEFIDEIRNLLPESWITNNESSGKKVNIYPPSSFGFTSEEWSNEGSQNCFEMSLDKSKVFIQRDFISVHGDEIDLVTELKVSDGFYNFLRAFLSREVIKEDKVIFHSSCILGKDNKAYFFLGHSGAGKTTVTSLSGNRLILGDDMNLCFKADGKFYASPAAIGGAFRPDMSYDEEFEVKGFYWLEQSSENSIKKLNKIQAKTKILASFANLFWESLSEAEIDFFMKFSSEIVENLPVYELCFTKSNDFWELIEDE